jgi:hypothetical protein
VSFAAAQARANTVVISRLANCTVVRAGTSFAGIFDADHIAALNGMIDAQGPQVLCASSDLAGATLRTPLTVDGVPYTVRAMHPDGTGLTLALLEKA